MPTSDQPSGEARIFLVHGHADERKYEVARFIEQETGQWPVILHEQADQSQTIIEKLERHGSAAGFAVVLLTADDEGKAQDADTLNSRARQNVVFEHGYFIGRLGRKGVVALYEDGVELPSDLSGVLYKKLSGDWKSDLLVELRAAGLAPAGTAGAPVVGTSEPVEVGGEDPAGGRVDDPSGRASAYITTWRHTTEGMEAVGAMHSLQKRLHHPGYGTRRAGVQPPTVRFGLLVACDPMGTEPSASELRAAFLALLDRPPLRSFVDQLAAIPNDMSWSTYDGNGRLTLGAILGDAADEQSAPIASVLVNLNDNLTNLHQNPRSAELVLSVEPRDATGMPAPPVTLERWHERLLTALEVPGAFVRFLTDQVGVETHGEPPVRLGIGLEARPNIGALVDTSPFAQIPGSVATSAFSSYLIADRGGRQPAHAAGDMLRTWCDHALHLDGYEEVLARLD